jgi:hypothetical protein
LDMAEAGEPGRYLDGVVEIGSAGPMCATNVPAEVRTPRVGSGAAAGRRSGCGPSVVGWIG